MKKSFYCFVAVLACSNFAHGFMSSSSGQLEYIDIIVGTYNACSIRKKEQLLEIIDGEEKHIDLYVEVQKVIGQTCEEYIDAVYNHLRTRGSLDI